MKRKIVVAVTGASGSIYAKILFDKLLSIQNKIDSIGVIWSNNAKIVWQHELKNSDFINLPFDVYEKYDFGAPFASGSAKYDTLIICPCSMGTLGRIATGISNDLLTRTADVMLKERRKLILVIRETPYSLIHLNNMVTLTQAGAIVCPASPSFYSQPQTIEDLASTVIDRVLDLANLPVTNTYRWGE
ncbi:MAG: UbiX family flavin prenyltransferase [Sphingobacteriales bacterium]|jgi:4-hydroxy-3-polyprenylbenzoate decarboxylase|nr:UbiX family flavin prenyltransferase [Sphingobacteriales bacterium]MBP9142400.1 UbiX family flavin prenyltransferase [Chitinophagales bacterium]MDA0199263.1 UbiX family flavin prenyltransferase [Bacteroidota bacterium]MBK6889698.1 UbiX family flavin prenyltransferase [Sphingobacteriales bacterium]MBK7527788.1 UbiX family flavin prenyltransferase [Sphingobacteriales bacterium]